MTLIPIKDKTYLPLVALIKNGLYDSLRKSINTSNIDSVWECVWSSVCRQVYESVKGPVHTSLWNLTYNPYKKKKIS